MQNTEKQAVDCYYYSKGYCHNKMIADMRCTLTASTVCDSQSKDLSQSYWKERYWSLLKALRLKVTGREK